MAIFNCKYVIMIDQGGESFRKKSGDFSGTFSVHFSDLFHRCFTTWSSEYLLFLASYKNR